MRNTINAGTEFTQSPYGLMLDALAKRDAEIVELRRLSITDGLTGIPNRRAFDQAIDMALERGHRRAADRTEGTVSMLICDVDHFKSVNDTYGHNVGDDVLKQVAKILQKHRRLTDTLARYGGEEFAIVLENCKRQDAMRIADEIRVAVLDAFVDGRPCKLTASFGVATLIQGENRSSLVKRADDALYAAKTGEGLDGKGRNIVYCSTETGRFEYIDRITGATQPVVQSGFEQLSKLLIDTAPSTAGSVSTLAL